MIDAEPALAPTVTATDRLSFTVFLASVIHVALITGIGFAMPDPAETPRSLEIIIAQRDQEKEPDEADFLAQSNQQGSGTLEEKRTPTTDQVAEYQDAEVQETVTPEAPPAAQPEPQPNPEVLAAPRPAADRLAISQSKEEQRETDALDAQAML